MEPQFQTKAGLAAESIRSAIRLGQLAPGERIIPEALTARLGMSPTPIREALRSLEAEGLVTNEPHRGMRVADFSTDAAAELYLLRADLESLATRLAVPRLTDVAIAELRDFEIRRADAMSKGEYARSSDLNQLWHMGIYGYAMETPYLTEFIGRLWNAFPWTTSWKIPGRGQRSLDDHAAILAAAARSDAADAGRLMEAHILSNMDAVLRLLEETHPAAQRG